MRHIISFSGGKDSLATLIWARENLDAFEVVFCDTGWESDITYQHIQNVQKVFDIQFKVLKSEYSFWSLSLYKKRVASTRARFCTEVLKVHVMIDYILSIQDDVVVYQGIRADESSARRKMKARDEYFYKYLEASPSPSLPTVKPNLLFPLEKIPSNKKRSTSRLYRKTDVLSHLDDYTVDVHRPIFKNTADEVFEMIRRAGIPPNPLYRLGFSRVGCFPCVQCRHGEVRQLVKHFPERISLIRNLENELGRTFFPPGYIPDKACKSVDPKSGRRIAFIDNVVEYLTANASSQLYASTSCESIYAICE